MPSQYFFHLKFELYQTPAPRSNPPRTSHLSHFSNEPTTAPFVPPPGLDVFKGPLPAHRTTRWASYSFSKRPVNLTNDISTSRPLQSLSGSHQTLPLPSEHSDSHGDALLLPERSASLRPDVPLSPQSRTGRKRSNTAAARDWRYEPVRIESIDMDTKMKSSASGGLHTKAVYLPSDPKTTEIGYGVVHLYRDIEESKILDENATPRRSLDGGPRPLSGQSDTLPPEDCTTLCILAVPSWMMPSDLLGFVGDQAAREDVSHFRLIRTGRANKYMVLMKFRAAKKAREWQKEYNGRLFSSAEPENCHVVFIKSVEFVSPNADVGTANFPQNTTDPFTTGDASGKSLFSKPQAPPPPNLLELPTCPVCLERMDETTGLLTILCQHVFHCACLEKWRGSGCPVCRYTHSPSYTFPYPRPPSLDGAEQEPEPLCSVCASTSNLWICLICGNIGCGRYDSAHAFAHYEATSHCYAMDITTQRVWDYAGDGYVHRLIQSKPTADASGRGVIDLPSRPRHENEAFRAEGGDSVPREKMESMATEYTYLLTSQLEGQRRYFEEQVNRAVDKASQASARAEEAAAHLAKVQAELDDVRSSNREVSDTGSRLERALEKSDKARAKFEQMARTMSSQLQEEKTMNEGLLQRIKQAEEETSKAKAEVKDLEDMNHDLTQFISAQEKVKELQAEGEEVVEMHLEPGKKGKGKKKK